MYKVRVRSLSVRIPVPTFLGGRACSSPQKRRPGHRRRFRTAEGNTVLPGVRRRESKIKGALTIRTVGKAMIDLLKTGSTEGADGSRGEVVAARSSPSGTFSPPPGPETLSYSMGGSRGASGRRRCGIRAYQDPSPPTDGQGTSRRGVPFAKRGRELFKFHERPRGI